MTVLFASKAMAVGTSLMIVTAYLGDMVAPTFAVEFVHLPY